MFGRKKKQPKKAKPTISMRIMPEEFYGGNDPEVYVGSTSTPVSVSASAGSAKKHRTGRFVFFKNKKVMWVGGGIFFVVFITIVSIYYLRQAGFIGGGGTPIEASIVVQEGVSDTRPAPVEEVIPIIPPVVENELETPTTSSEDIAFEQAVVVRVESSTNNDLVFPPTILTDTPDSDADTLTDEEEALFGTDTGTWDSDGDGYHDGQEVLNLYNPRAESPRSILDAGLVREYQHPGGLYRLYYPAVWQLGEVEQNANTVLINAIGGDFVAVHAVPRAFGQTFDAWFADHATDQQFTSLRSFENRFDQPVWKRQDGLVGYVEDTAYVYVFIYNPGLVNRIPYRHVMEMILQSVHIGGERGSLQTQPTLPSAPVFSSSTTTTEI